MITIEARISGIPCQARMLSFYQGSNNFDDPSEVDYEILDKKGYKAAWLHDKITADESLEIEGNLIKAHFDDIADERAQRELDKRRGK